VLAGFAVAGVSPLALVAVSLATATGLRLAFLVPATAAGLALFVAPLAVWSGFSRSIASEGGLYAFVERAAGSRLAKVQGWIWIVSYLLYLPYTVTYIVYYLLPYVLPLRGPWPQVLEVALPVVLSLAVLTAERAALVALAVLAAAEMVGAVALAAFVLLRPAPGRAVALALPAPHVLPAFIGGAAQVSLLLVCLSLVVFLGGEAQGGGAAIRRALAVGFAAVCVVTLAGAVALAAGGTASVIASWLPGVALLRRADATGLATGVGVVALVGIAGVIVAEFVALVRLGGTMLGLDRRTGAALVAAFFVFADVASLANPQRFYTVAIAPSVVALYLSQLVVFLAFPVLAVREGRGRSPGPWLVAAVAVVWSLVGLYGAVTGAVSAGVL